MDLLQRAHVDDDAAAHLRLSEWLVPLAARRDLQTEVAREVDHRGDVAHRSRPQHGYRLLVDDLAVVARVFAASRRIERELAVQLRQIGERRAG